MVFWFHNRLRTESDEAKGAEGPTLGAVCGLFEVGDGFKVAFRLVLIRNEILLVLIIG